MAVTDEFIADVAEALDTLGYAVENEDDVIDDVSQINDDVTLPAIRVSGGIMGNYVSMKLAVLKTYLDNLYAAILTQWNSWFGTSDSEVGTVRYKWVTIESNATTDHSTAQSDHSTAANDHTTAQSDHTAVAGAENLNVTLDGMIITVTNRNGTQTSTHIGFDIYNTYPSVAAMNADAANVPTGKFVMIATTDPTSVENARLYGKNAQGSFTFLSDLDQAASTAWAEWLNTYKPSIIDATTLATTQGNRAKAYNDHPWEIRSDGYIYVWDETTSQMKKTNKMIIGFDDLTPEQRQSMIDDFYASLVIATDAVCEEIVDELTA